MTTLHTESEGPTPVFKRFGGKEGPLMAEIYIFCFPIFFPNMSGISDFKNESSIVLYWKNLSSMSSNSAKIPKMQIVLIKICEFLYLLTLEAFPRQGVSALTE